MEVLTFCPRDYFGSNTHILFSADECAVIDPSVNYSELRSLIEQKGSSVKYIILTHGHFDHILKIDSWVNNTDAKVLVGSGDGPMLSDSYLNCYKSFLGIDRGYFGDFIAVNEFDSFELGEEKFRIIETPGHSPGSVSILFDDTVFVGDTVFADGGVGRYDLPGNNVFHLQRSIEKLLSLPEQTKVYCGHGKATTIEQLKTKINFI